MIVGKADTQVETQSNKAAESSEAWTDGKLYTEVAKAAERKLPANGITIESMQLQRNKLFSAVAASWKSSMGLFNTARLEDELVTRLNNQLDLFINAQAAKVIANVTHYSKRSQVDFKNRQLHWKLALTGKELMDLKEQKLHCTFHVTERERRLKDLLAKPGDWIESIKECERQINELRVIGEAIEVKIASLPKV